MASLTFEPALGSHVALQQHFASSTSDDAAAAAATAALHVYASSLPSADQGTLEVWFSTSDAETPWQAAPFAPLNATSAAGTASVPLSAASPTRFTYRLRSQDGESVQWFGAPHSDVVVHLEQVAAKAATVEDVVELEHGVDVATDDEGVTRFSMTTGAEATQQAFARVKGAQQVMSIEHTLPTWHTTRLCQPDQLSTQHTSPLLLVRLAAPTISHSEATGSSTQTAGSLLILLALTTASSQASLLGGHASRHDVASLQLGSAPGAHAQADAQSVVLAALCASTELHATIAKVLSAARTELASSEATCWLASAATSHAMRAAASISDSANDSGCALSDDKPSEHGDVEADEEDELNEDEEVSMSSPSAASFNAPQPLFAASTPPRARQSSSLDASRGLALCTWEALSHQAPKLSLTLAALANMEARAPGACTALLLDDGWAVYERMHDGSTRGALALLDLDPSLIHDDAPEDRSYLQHYIESVKSRFSSIQDVGVWLTLIGHWDGLSNALADAYGPAVHATLQGPHGRRAVLLPAAERLADFWNDALRSLASSGVTFIKLDAQSELESLKFDAYSVPGAGAETAYVAQAHVAFEQAAARFLGDGAVINCMAMGGAVAASARVLAGRSAQWRATDDVVPGHADAGRWLLTHAARLSLLFAADEGAKPDADMLCSTGADVGQLEAYAQASFRALYSPARIFVSDSQAANAQCDALQPLLAPSRGVGGVLGPLRTLQVSQTSRISPSSLWQDINGSDASAPLAISSSWSLTSNSEAKAAVLGTWNVSSNSSIRSSLRVRDVADALSSAATKDVIICSSQSTSAAFISRATLEATTAAARLSTPSVVPLTLGAQECATFSIAPLFALTPDASVSATCLGLADKYAGQCAVLDIHTTTSPDASQTLTKATGTSLMALPSASTLLVGMALLALHALLSLRILPRFIHQAIRFVMERMERAASPAARRLASVDIRALAKERVRPGQLRIEPVTPRTKEESALQVRLQRAGTARFVALFNGTYEKKGKWHVSIDGVTLGACCVREEELQLTAADGRTATLLSVDMEYALARKSRGVRWSDDELQQQTQDEGEGGCWVVKLWRS